MELALATEEAAFRGEIREFIDRHWPGSVRAVHGRMVPGRERSSAESAWFDALVARGWSVPDWPVAHGGTAWSALQSLIWETETARAAAPQVCVAGAYVLGPLLCRWGNPEQQARFLPPIREARVRWCVGEPVACAPLERRSDRYVVNAPQTPVPGAATADWMLCPVATGSVSGPSTGISLLLIDLTSPGVVIGSAAAGSAHGGNVVTMSNVQVPMENLLGRENGGSQYLAGLTDRRVPMVASRLQFERLAQIAADLPGDVGRLADDPGFQLKSRELEVALLGLEVLELRAVDAERGSAAALPSTLRTVVELRRATVDQQIADLTLEALGYYALPLPDELLIDNEGPIGHDYALSALQSWLSRRDVGSVDDKKDLIAGSAFGSDLRPAN